MKNLITLFLCALTYASFSQCKINYANFPHVVEETFNNTSIQALKNGTSSSGIEWQFDRAIAPGCLKGWGSEQYSEDQVSFVNDPTNSQNQFLRLTAVKVHNQPDETCGGDPKKHEYQSGMIMTKRKYANSDPGEIAPYGIFEARIKLPESADAWGGLWMFGWRDTEPTLSGEFGHHSFELDITEMESGEATTNNVHSYGLGHPTCVQYINTNENDHEKFSDDFHVYSAMWNKDEITFFIDGRETRTITEEIATNMMFDFPTIDRWGNTTFLDLIVSLQSDVWDGGDGWDQTFQMDIDWIKIRRPSPNASPDDYLVSCKSNNEWLNTNISEETVGLKDVHSDHGSITRNPLVANETFYRGTDNKMYRVVKVNNNFIKSTVYSGGVYGDLVYSPQLDGVIFKGTNNKIKIAKKVSWGFQIKTLNPWSYNASSTPGSICITPNGRILYKASNGRIHYFLPNTIPNSSYYQTGQISQNNWSKQTKGDLVAHTDNHVIYKGNDNRMQIYWFNGGNYQHAYIDTYWYTSSYKVSSRHGSIAYAPGKGMLYRGTDDKLHRFYWNGSGPNYFTHHLISHNYNSNPNYTNGDKILGNIVWDNLNKRLAYRAYDGRIQYFSNSSSTWKHGYYDNYFNTTMYAAKNHNSGGFWNYPSISLGADEKIYYRNKNGKLSYFDWVSCENLNPDCYDHTDPEYFMWRETVENPIKDERLDFKLFPNPINDQLNVHFENFDEDIQSIDYTIQSVFGQQIQAGTFSQKNNYIDCQEFKAGYYILLLNSEGTIQSKSFLKVD